MHEHSRATAALTLSPLCTNTAGLLQHRPCHHCSRTQQGYCSISLVTTVHEHSRAIAASTLSPLCTNTAGLLQHQTRHHCARTQQGYCSISLVKTVHDHSIINLVDAVHEHSRATELSVCSLAAYMRRNSFGCLSFLGRSNRLKTSSCPL